MNANRQTVATSIPKEHMRRVLNSLLCERLLGFERQLNKETAVFEWRGRKKGGVLSEWSEALVDFAGDLKEAQHMLQQFCRQAGIGYNLIYDFRTDKHSVMLLEVGPDDQPIPRVEIHGASQLPEAIAAAICGFAQFDIQAQHKTLHPGNYLLLSS